MVKGNKLLIIFAHPNNESFLADLKESFIESHLHQKIKEINLYQEKADFFYKFHKADKIIKKYQKMIDWADTLIFFFPCWWFNIPAIMKGFIDVVFEYGWAFRSENGKTRGLLESKSAYIFTTYGSSFWQVRMKHKDPGLKSLVYGTLSVCGIKTKKIYRFYQVSSVFNKKRVHWLEKMKKI